MSEEAYDVLSYLQRKSVPIKGRQGQEVNVPCWYHDEDSGKRGRLYVNVGTNPDLAGLHYCHKCGERGNLVTLMRWFGDEAPGARREDDSNPYIRSRILAEAADYYQSNLGLDHLKWLKEERCLTVDTIKRHQLGWADGGLYKHLKDKSYELKDMLSTGLVVVEKDDQQEDGKFTLGAAEGRPYDFLRDCITIPYHITGNVVLIRGKKIGAKYLTPPGQDARLFNTDATWHAEEVVVCEGEFDTMIVEQMGFPAVGLGGAVSWQESWNGYMDEARKVYVLFDNDKAGHDGALKVREQVGRKARIVTMPLPDDPALKPGDNDISEYFGKGGHTAGEFEALLRSVRTGILVSVHDAYEQWRTIQGEDGLKFGYEKLDSLLAPGIMPGQIVVPLAKTNTGKTIHMLNVFQRMKMLNDDIKILFLSLEQTRGDWFERARRIWAFYNMEAPLNQVNERSISYWENNFWMTDINRMSNDDIIGAYEDFRSEVGQPPDFVALDYLGYYAQSFKSSSRYERVSDAVMSLKGCAKDLMVPFFAPHQVSRGAGFGEEIDLSDARDSGAIEETADFVFAMWNEDTKKGVDPQDREGVVNMRIAKSRNGGKGHKIQMQFGYSTLVMVPAEEHNLVSFAKDELAYSARGESWEDAILRHKSGQKDGPLLSFKA